MADRSPRRRLWLLLLTASALAAYAARGAARAPFAQTPTFRAGVNLTEVDTVVTDAHGQFVGDLTADDFQLLENGKPQTIVSATLVRLPIAPAAAPVAASAAPSDVQSNDAASLGRVYAIVLDTFHVAPTHTALARLRAKQFIDRDLMPGDLACVVTLGNSATSQEFTSDKTLLDAAVDRFIGEKVNSVIVDQLIDEQRGGTGVDSEVPLRVNQIRDAATGVMNVARALSDFAGRRKALIFVSEGFDFDVTASSGARGAAAAPPPPPPMSASGGSTGRRGTATAGTPSDTLSVFQDAQAYTPEMLDLEAQMVEEALRVNVQIYTIDPRGAAATEVLLADLPPEAAAHHNMTSELHQEVERSQGMLRTLADESGGESAVNTDEFDAAFSRFVEDNSEYYVIAYAPSNTKSDGKYRNVVVKVARPGLTVRARKGYYAPTAAAAPSPGDSLTRLIKSSLPASGLSLHLTAAVLGPADAGLARVTAVLEMDGAHLTFTPKNDAFADTIDVGYVVPTAEGALVASKREAVALTLDAETRAAVAATGVRYVTEFSLPPGRYHMRMAAAEEGHALGGSVGFDLDVPNESTTPLVLDQLLITTGRARAMQTIGEWSSVKSLLPAPPAALRQFLPTDVLAVMAHVHARPPAASTAAAVCTAVVTADNGRDVLTKKQDQPMADLTAADGWPYELRLPLDTLAAGRYRLTVAIAVAGTDAHVSRTVPFEIAAAAR